MALDKVFIEQLEVITTIGVYDWEQEIKQKLVLDIEMAHDNRPAGKSDDVVDAFIFFDAVIAFHPISQIYKIQKIQLHD